MLVPLGTLQKPPSLEDGIDAATEGQLRIFGTELIQRAGMLLRVPQITIVSASTTFQRFYFRKSFADVEVRSAAAAALLLACKLEETHRNVRDVITVFHRLQMHALQEQGEHVFAGKPTPFLDPNCREYLETKHDVVRAERHILRELSFEVGLLLDHPHKYVLQYIKALKCSNVVAQKAWNYLNDSMRTPLCCMFEPHKIAATSIYLAARSLGIKLVTDPPWWEAFDTDVEDMQCIAGTLMTLYRKPPVRYISVPKKRVALPLEPVTPFAETPGPEEDGPGITMESNILGNSTQRDVGLELSQNVEVLIEQEGVEPVSKQPLPLCPLIPPNHLPLSAKVADEKRRGKREKERESERDKEKRREKDRNREKVRKKEKKERDREREYEKWRDKHKNHEKHKRNSSNDSSHSCCMICSSRSRAKSRSRSMGRKERIRSTKAKDRRSKRSASSASHSSRSRKEPKRRNKYGVDERDL